jgi:hypothetical protein
MNDAFRKLIETFLPWLVEERTTRTIVYWLFWLTTACIAWLFIVSNPVFGWFVVLAPVLLVWLTSRLGLSRVNGVLLGVVLTLALFPAFFLGMAQASEEVPTGFVLAGLLIFLVWVAAFPTMLDHVDRHYRVKRDGPDDDPFAEYRLMLVRLWMATMIMSVVGESLAALVCVAALLYRRKWTAALAGVACLVCPLLSITYGEIGWDADVIDVIAAGMSAYSWYGALRNPHWGGGMFLPRTVTARLRH